MRIVLGRTSTRMEIMFDDLKEHVQKELLKIEGLEKPEDANWDVVPLFVYEKSEEA